MHEIKLTEEKNPTEKIRTETLMFTFNFFLRIIFTLASALGIQKKTLFHYFSTLYWQHEQ